MTVEFITGNATSPPPPMPTYTWASKPGTAPVGSIAFISDAGTIGSHWYYDGTAWNPVGGQAELATLDASTAGIGNAETFALQYRIPANLWQVGNILRTTASFVKSGNTDIGQISVRIGPLGTTADQAIYGPTQILGAANRQTSMTFDIRLESPTSCQLMPNTAFLGYTVNNALVAAPVTIGSNTGPLFFSIGALSLGTTDTVTFMQLQTFLVGKVT